MRRGAGYCRPGRRLQPASRLVNRVCGRRGGRRALQESGLKPPSLLGEGGGGGTEFCGVADCIPGNHLKGRPMIRPTIPQDAPAILAFLVATGLFDADEIEPLTPRSATTLQGARRVGEFWLTDEDSDPVGGRLLRPGAVRRRSLEPAFNCGAARLSGAGARRGTVASC